jgi:hypothetical protein
MDPQAWVEVLKPLVFPVIGTALAAVAKGLWVLLRKLRSRTKEGKTQPATPVPLTRAIVLPPGVAWPDETAPPERQPEEVFWRLTLVRNLIDRLPPIPRRVTVWKATVFGSIFVGFGIAGYFRTGADVVVGIVLSSPVLIAVAFVPTDDSGSQSSEADTPVWALGVIYTTMAVTGLYSYARATSSNARLESTFPSRHAPPTRRDILEHELQILSAERWRVESKSEFDAIVYREKRPNHLLHAVLTLLTMYIWAVVWIAQTRSSRQKHELEYRHVTVDEGQRVSIEPWTPKVSGAGAAT